MFYLRYLCLHPHSGLQHILCCVFVLFFMVLFIRIYGLKLSKNQNVILRDYTFQ
jgi:hypothetical protein